MPRRQLRTYREGSALVQPHANGAAALERADLFAVHVRLIARIARPQEWIGVAIRDWVGFNGARRGLSRTDSFKRLSSLPNGSIAAVDESTGGRIYSPS